jgi:uncharacterized membrane protein
MTSASREPDRGDAGYGAAPEPGSAYPSATEGGFTGPALPGPDPRGQYGPPGPGYAPGDPAAYGAQPPRATASLGRAWAAFIANPWPFVVAQLLWLVVMAVPVGVLLAALGALGAPQVHPDGAISGGPRALLGIGGALVVAVIVLLAVIQLGAFASATVKTVDGDRVALRDFFGARHPGQLLLLALILAVASAVLAITVVGPLIVMLVGIWAVFFVADRGEPATGAIGSGLRLVLRAPGQTLLLMLLGYLLSLAGALACMVGTLVTGPVVLLAVADFYRRSLSRP